MFGQKAIRNPVKTEPTQQKPSEMLWQNTGHQYKTMEVKEEHQNSSYVKRQQSCLFLLMLAIILWSLRTGEFLPNGCKQKTQINSSTGS